FFLRRIDKGTGIDHEHVGIFRAGGDFHAAFQYATEHDFGIDQIFRATKADHPHLGPLWQLWWQACRLHGLQSCSRHGCLYRETACRLHYSVIRKSVSPLETILPFLRIWTASRSSTRTLKR